MPLIGSYQRIFRSLFISCGNCLRHVTIAASTAHKPTSPLSHGPKVASTAIGKATSAKDTLLTWVPTKSVTAQQTLQVDDYFKLDHLVSKRQLFEHRVYLGHKAGCRSEWMTPHLFGCRCGVDIIDLEQTAPLLRRALNFTAHVAARGGIVLFFWQGWPALGPLIERRVHEMGEFAYTRPWVDQLMTDTGNYFDTATRLPDLAIFLSCLSPLMLPHPAISTCAKVMIPTVGICDSNADPRLVTYPVPGNDDSPQAIRLYLALFAEAIRRGKLTFAESAAAAAAAATTASTDTVGVADAAPDAAAFRQFQTQVLRDDTHEEQQHQQQRQWKPRTQTSPEDQNAAGHPRLDRQPYKAMHRQKLSRSPVTSEGDAVAAAAAPHQQQHQQHNKRYQGQRLPFKPRTPGPPTDEQK